MHMLNLDHTVLKSDGWCFCRWRCIVSLMCLIQLISFKFGGQHSSWKSSVLPQNKVEQVKPCSKDCYISEWFHLRWGRQNPWKQGRVSLQRGPAAKNVSGPETFSRLRKRHFCFVCRIHPFKRSGLKWASLQICF